MATIDLRRFHQQQGDGRWCVKTPIPTLHIHTWRWILTLITGLPKNAITSRSAKQGDARHREGEAQPLNPILGDLDRSCSCQASEIDQQWLRSLCGSLQDPKQMPLIWANTLFLGTRCTNRRAVHSPRVPPPMRRPGKLERSCGFAAVGNTAPRIRTHNKRCRRPAHPMTRGLKEKTFHRILLNPGLGNHSFTKALPKWWVASIGAS